MDRIIPSDARPSQPRKGKRYSRIRGQIMTKTTTRTAGRLRRPSGFCAFLLLLVCSPLYPKTAGITAIEIYPGPNGQAYEQIADFILNEKNEVYLCGSTSSIDKNAYHKLAKVSLAAGMTLERDAKGVLTLTQTSGAACVVPGNLKFDKGQALTPAQLADQAAIVGTVLPAADPATTQILPLKAGVKIVFVPAPDQEMAEYLRAERQGDISGWQAYLKKYAAGAHADSARKALAALDLGVASTDQQAYENSKPGAAWDFSKLAEARQMVDQASELSPNDALIADLRTKIHSEVLSLSHAATDKLNLYKQALSQKTAGYANLIAAEKLANGASSTEPATPEAVSVKSQTTAARASLDRILRDTESRIAARHADEAAQAIDPLRSFAQEDREISDDLNAIVALYVADAKQLEEQPDWSGAVKELEKASATLASPETTALLNEARKQAKIAADKAAATVALQKSQDSMGRADVIAAYEVLDDLPPEQRALVADNLNSLKDQYVQAAEQAATAEQKAHEPINGMSDEEGIQRAYGYVQRCYKLTNDPTLQDRLVVLGEELSTWYLQQGKKYAEKPDGTGVNVGWTYLSEAQQYKSQDNLSAIHDEMTTVRPAYVLKSRLSVKVVFRDQTSRRDAGNFPAQLTDALATGLESAGLGVRVIRQQDTTPVQPNFQLVGDVLQHEMTTSQDNVPKESKYRFGQQEIPNEAWVQANRAYENANDGLTSARSVLQGAQTRGKKNEIKNAQQAVNEDEKKVEDLREKLDLIPKSKMLDEERPYTYTQIVYHLRTVVEVQFQILDSASEEVVPRVSVQTLTPREYSILQNVKPEDTQGVQNAGIVPNDNDFFEADENKTRDELIDKAKAKVADLPGIVLSRADRKAADGDNDGAAELYILYLNATPATDTPERARAKAFLAAQFNFKDIGKAAISE